LANKSDFSSVFDKAQTLYLQVNATVIFTLMYTISSVFPTHLLVL